MLRRVANVGLDGSTVSMSLGKLEIRILKAGYGDSLKPESLSYMGSQKIDETTPGIYETDEGSITMSAVKFRTELMPAMPTTGGGNVRIPIVFTRTHPDLGSDSDLCENCRFTNWAAALENSAKAEEVELKFKPQQIKWTDERKTINALVGAAPTGPVGF
jgi:hypothetical protein